MINTKELQKFRLSGDKEKVKVADSIYAALLDSKNQCEIDFWPSSSTITMLIQHACNLTFSKKTVRISW